MCSTYTDNTRQGREKLKKRAMVHLLLRIRRVLGLYEGRTEYDGGLWYGLPYAFCGELLFTND
jgi:hypothetical protein